MLLRANNVDIATIALWLGHETTQTTHLYEHANPALKERAIARTAPLGAKPGRYHATDELLASSKRCDYVERLICRTPALQGKSLQGGSVFDVARASDIETAGEQSPVRRALVRSWSADGRRPRVPMPSARTDEDTARRSPASTEIALRSAPRYACLFSRMQAPAGSALMHDQELIRRGAVEGAVVLHSSPADRIDLKCEVGEGT